MTQKITILFYIISLISCATLNPNQLENNIQFRGLKVFEKKRENSIGYISFYKNGSIKEIGNFNFKQGYKKNGYYVKLFENSKLSTKLYLDSCKKIGSRISVVYNDESEKLEFKINGNLDSSLTNCYKGMKPKSISVKHLGEKYDAIEFFSTGELKSKVEKRQNSSIVTTNYFKSGKIKDLDIKQKQNGQTSLFIKSFYEDGKVYRVEKKLILKNGFHKSLAEKTFDKHGVRIAHVPYKLQPQFPGGSVALLRFVSENINYPKECINKEIEGTVYVEFTVGKDGVVCDPELGTSVHPLLDQAAIAVIQKLPNFKPGKIDGNPAEFSFYFPVKFKIN